MPQITATFPTKLKAKPIASSQLKPEEAIDIPKGQGLWVESISPAPDNHRLVKLTFRGWKQGFVYGPHWKLPAGQSVGLVGNAAPRSQGLITKIVPSRKDFVMQPDSQTCQSAAIAMITGEDVWAIRDALTAQGVAGDPTIMGNYLRDRVKEYKFKLDASLNDMRRAIDEGWQLITHSYYSGSGHVIKVSGYEASPDNLSYRFIIDDPWAEHNAKRWTYAPWDRSGDNVRYSAHSMYAACVAAQSVYDAADIYNRGMLDSNQAGAWLHYCKI